MTGQPGAGALTVLRAGPLTTVQDLGRPGYAHLGVPRSGAVDGASLRLANRLVGNPESSAGLETTLVGVDIRLDRARYVAITGALAPITIDGRQIGAGAAVYLPAGATLRVGSALRGLRSYLAVGGGLAVPPVLGSRATDRLSGLGPPPLRSGDTVPLGRVTAPPPGADAVPAPLLPDEPVLRIRPGPRADWFGPEALTLLATERYTVSPDSDRIGIRLAGPPLARAVHQELPSEGLVLGAVQVPTDGQPVLFLADHPTTGGYPVVGVVDPADIWLAAQARPGMPMRFRLVSARPR